MESRRVFIVAQMVCIGNVSHYNMFTSLRIMRSQVPGGLEIQKNPAK